MVTLDASFILRSTGDQRTARAEDFFLSYMTTLIEPGELLVEISVPSLPAKAGWSYQEVSRRYGDFALAGAGAVLALAAWQQATRQTGGRSASRHSAGAAPWAVRSAGWC